MEHQIASAPSLSSMAGKTQLGLPSASVPQQGAGVLCPQTQDFGISILGQGLFLLMKTLCPSTAGTERLLLTLVPAAALLISKG